MPTRRRRRRKGRPRGKKKKVKSLKKKKKKKKKKQMPIALYIFFFRRLLLLASSRGCKKKRHGAKKKRKKIKHDDDDQKSHKGREAGNKKGTATESGAILSLSFIPSDPVFLFLSLSLSFVQFLHVGNRKTRRASVAPHRNRATPQKGKCLTKTKKKQNKNDATSRRIRPRIFLPVPSFFLVFFLFLFLSVVSA